MNAATTTPVVDLVFSIAGVGALPADHARPLFAAVSRLVPEIHGDGAVGGPFGIHPIRGRQSGRRELRIDERSRLTIRTPVDRIATLLPLTGASLEVANVPIRVSVPTIRPLTPAPSLRSRLVTVKLRELPVSIEGFRAAVRRQLDGLGVSTDVEIELPARRSWSGEPRDSRRTLAVKERQIIGFEVRLHGLSAAESLAVQSAGIGGRRTLGCGLFGPWNTTKEGRRD